MLSNQLHQTARAAVNVKSNRPVGAGRFSFFPLVVLLY
jgi:hypothetical protein